jgi:hypothetical protein
MFVLVSLLLMVLSTTGNGFANASYPLCGDCWCAIGNNSTTCPVPAPASEFSKETVSLFQSKIASSVITLECNPYKDDKCTTTPVQDPLLLASSDSVCAFLYSGDCPANKYEMITYPSRQAAEDAGAYVTHLGVCGLCSTAQDLSIYLIKDFTTAGKKCAVKGLLHEKTGLKCYEELGLTPECAKIWNYDGIFDGKKCMTSCITHLNDPNNGPPPTCSLNKCLQCDEDKAGPIFSQFAARTRRRSGLVSEIIRDCDTIAMGIEHDPHC